MTLRLVTLDVDVVCAAGVDLCVESDHGCEHICESSPGSYHCLCLPGYTLNDDGKTCAGNKEGPKLTGVVSFQTFKPLRYCLISIGPTVCSLFEILCIYTQTYQTFLNRKHAVFTISPVFHGNDYRKIESIQT